MVLGKGAERLSGSVSTWVFIYALSILPFFRDFPGIQLNPTGLTVRHVNFMLRFSDWISGSLKLMNKSCTIIPPIREREYGMTGTALNRSAPFTSTGAVVTALPYLFIFSPL